MFFIPVSLLSMQNFNLPCFRILIINHLIIKIKDYFKIHPLKRFY